jgi:cation-transporting ATPase F
MPLSAANRRAEEHHALADHQVLLLLQTHPTQGLTQAEAADRLHRYGPNLLPQVTSGGPIRRLARQLQNPLIYVLIAAGAVTVALGELVEAAVIFGVVVINAVVGFIQESKAEAELDALRSLVRTSARVVRAGRTESAPSETLVPGDLVAVEAGDKVPADIRLLRVAELQADESALTGESVPVVKDEVALPIDTPVADRRNMLYSGTLITTGSGAGIVVATGSHTELGEIHRLVGSVDPLATPLTRRLAWFSKVLTVVILGLAAVTFLVGVLRGEPWPEMFSAAVALAVGAIPEGLPAAVTITLAIGVGRMARRRAVIRRLPAVETLGSTTVICTDKTGTLTQNQMTVRSVWTAAGGYHVAGQGYDPAGHVTGPGGATASLAADEALAWTLRAGVLCNDASLHRGEGGQWQVVGDPTEAALLVAAAKAGLAAADLRSAYPRRDTVPFTSQRQFMATLHDEVGGGEESVVLVKGAVERILALSGAQMDAAGAAGPLHGRAGLDQAAAMAATGLRVLATAVLRPEPGLGFEPEALAGRLVFTGLVAMLDPPRPAAVDAVRSCQVAGIDVKMITGDHAATAAAIAEQVGILRPDHRGAVLTGAELAALPAEEAADAVAATAVFARVSPEQKLRLVDALQARGQVVAMTGDGVNDAPALRQADIGVAMGFGGTEVAKEAADMVLTDDDFATIEAAVEEGRGVFDNLVKFIVWTLPTNMGEGLVILVAIMLGAALPILPVQILWINMTTAVALGLMLAFEPKEPGIMTRAPRDSHQPLLSMALIVRILLVSAVLVGGSWWVFQWEQASGASLAESRTAAVNLFVVVEAFYLFSCRSLTGPARRIGLFSNPWLIVGVSIQAVGQLALTYWPVMNEIFGTEPISATAWARILAVGLAAWVVVALDKRWRGLGI